MIIITQNITTEKDKIRNTLIRSYKIQEEKLKIINQKIDKLEIKLSNIKKIIQERKEKANNSKLPGKIQKVAIAFGEHSDWGGGTYYYHGKGFHIDYCFHSQKYITVNLGYNKKDVFAGELHQNGVARIDLYIPGDWEKEIEELFNKIPEVEENRETKKLQNKIDDLTKEWQLEGLV